VFIVDGYTAEEIVEKWFDPAFEEFIDKEIVRKTSPKQKM